MKLYLLLLIMIQEIHASVAPLGTLRYAVFLPYEGAYPLGKEFALAAQLFQEDVAAISPLIDPNASQVLGTQWTLNSSMTKYGSLGGCFSVPGAQAETPSNNFPTAVVPDYGYVRQIRCSPALAAPPLSFVGLVNGGVPDPFFTQYEHIIDVYDTRCDAGTALAALVDVYTGETIAGSGEQLVALGGPICPGEMESQNLLSNIFQLPQVVPLAGSEALSDKQRYPLLLRMGSSDTDLVSSFLAVCQYFGWRKVGTLLSSDGDSANLFLVNEFQRQGRTAGVDVIYTEVLRAGGTIETTRAVLREMRSAGVRIIVLGVDFRDARLVLAGMAQEDMLEGFQLIGRFPAGAPPLWQADPNDPFAIDGLEDDIRRGVVGIIAVADKYGDPFNEFYRYFLARYVNKMVGPFNNFSTTSEDFFNIFGPAVAANVPYFYDSLLAVFMGAHDVFVARGFPNFEMLSDAERTQVREEIRTGMFSRLTDPAAPALSGTTGLIRMDASGNRPAKFDYVNLQGFGVNPVPAFQGPFFYRGVLKAAYDGALVAANMSGQAGGINGTAGVPEFPVSGFSVTTNDPAWIFLGNTTEVPRDTPLSPSSSSGDGDGSSAVGLSVGSAAGVLVGLCLLVMLVLCCVLCCCAGLALILIVAVVLMAVIGALIIVVALAGVGTGAGVYITKTRKRLEASYDLRALEGYDGEEVADGLLREFRELAIGDLTFDRKVGEGAFGRVFCGRWRDATIVAIKELNVQADEAAKAEFIHEANIMAKLGNHPNVIHFIGAVTTEDRFYMVSEFAFYGSLADFLGDEDRNGPFFPSILLTFALDAAKGLAHLHDEGIVHRDVAARNFLVAKDKTILISDFGMSRVIETAGGADEAGAQSTKSNLGPLRWMAPESMSRREFSHLSDSYMFGSFVFELVTRRVPFHDMDLQDVIVAVSKHDRRPRIPINCPSVFAELMKKCWATEPNARPSIKRIVAYLQNALQEGDDHSVADLDVFAAQSESGGVLPRKHSLATSNESGTDRIQGSSGLNSSSSAPITLNEYALADVPADIDPSSSSSSADDEDVGKDREITALKEEVARLKKKNRSHAKPKAERPKKKAAEAPTKKTKQ